MSVVPMSLSATLAMCGLPAASSARRALASSLSALYACRGFRRVAGGRGVGCGGGGGGRGIVDGGIGRLGLEILQELLGRGHDAAVHAVGDFVALLGGVDVALLGGEREPQPALRHV